MSPKFKLITVLAAVYGMMMCFSTSCRKEKNELVHDHAHEHVHEGHEHGDDHDHEGHEGHDHGNGQEIILEPEQAERMGVRTAVVNSGVFNDALQVTGKIGNRNPDMAAVSAPTPGIFTFSDGITEGMTVKKGQTIGTIRANDMTGGDINVHDRTNLENAKRELDRLDTLYQKQLVTADRYYAALAEYEIAKAKYSPEAAKGIVTVPEGGILSDLLVRSGQYVEVGTEVARITDASMLTLTAEVPDKYTSMISQFNTARIVPNGGGAPVDLSSLGAHRVTSASTVTTTPGYVPVVFTFRKDSRFIPGSVVEVYLLGEKRSDVVSVPLRAVTEQQGQYFVYVKLDDEEYLKSPVTLGARDGRSVEILSGLHVGDVVVVEGVTALRLAETSGAVPEGHSHSH